MMNRVFMLFAGLFIVLRPPRDIYGTITRGGAREREKYTRER